jgi:hypothetical protein
MSDAAGDPVDRAKGLLSLATVLTYLGDVGRGRSDSTGRR